MKPYLLLITACLCTGYGFGGSFDLLTDRQVPDEVRPANTGGVDEPDSSSDYLRARLIPAKPKPRLESLADDERKKARHCEKVRKRRDAIANGIHEPKISPRIFSIERLSNGRVLLAWEGSQESHYLARCHKIHERGEQAWWDGRITPIPLYQGVGEWTDDEFFESTRYYAVHHLAGYDSRDPLPDSERLSGTVTIRKVRGAPADAILRIFDATGSPTSQGKTGEKIGDGIYRLELGELTPGRHEFHAELCNVWDNPGAKTTGERPSGGGWFRTPSIYFDVPGELPHHFVGLRASWHVESPDVMALVAELAPHYGAWELAIHDSKGRKVRTWKGETDREQGSSLCIPTDERGDDGTYLPGGRGGYEARLTAEFEWRGKNVRECIARLELPSFGRFETSERR